MIQHGSLQRALLCAPRLFASADKGRKGFLTRQEFKGGIRRSRRPSGYFDENQGKITRKEFVERPSVFILHFDRNGHCRVTPNELTAVITPSPTGGPQERPRDWFH